MKLTGCFEGQFTCSDGECISMERRCDHVFNCRDRSYPQVDPLSLELLPRSDERSCQLLDLEEGYNKIVPPFTGSGQLNQEGKPTIIPVLVNISISLLNIVQIQEVDFSITFQFEIKLEWLEYRANYNNLKPQIYMNTLTKDDVEKLWLPMVIYKNTDQKERTRLGENWEWTTNVFISQEGGFTNSSDEVVDETRIFKGSENRLTMQQTYAHKFQCSFKLGKYPFDTQVPQLYFPYKY